MCLLCHTLCSCLVNAVPLLTTSTQNSCMAQTATLLVNPWRGVGARAHVRMHVCVFVYMCLCVCMCARVCLCTRAYRS